MAPHLRLSSLSALAVLAVFAFIGIAALAGLESRRTYELETAREAAQTVATLLAAHTRDSIAATNQKLLIARQEIGAYLERGGEGYADAHRLLRRHAEQSPSTEYWGVFDPAGDLMIDMRQLPARDINIADRLYFQRNLEAADAGLVVSGPFDAKAGDYRAFSLSRRIESDDGTLLGVLVVTYDIARLSRFVRAASRAAGTEVRLLYDGDDGVIPYFGNVSIGPEDGIEVKAAIAGTRIFYEVARSHDAILVEWYASRRSSLIGIMTCAIMTAIAASVVTTHLYKRRAMVEALKRAHEEAKMASDAKTDFMATISHEIRTPLNGVLGMARLLAQTPLDRDQAHMLDAVNASGEQLMRIINDVLDMARLENGSLSIVHEPFALAETVDAASQSVRALAAEKTLSLEVYVAPEAQTYVLGDAVRLQQILINFLTNAIKFTDQGRIALSCRIEDRSGAFWAHFEVSDTGIGIPPDQLERVFSRFTQVDSSLKRRSGGSGLGLAIVKTLAEVMGGEVGARSMVGIGSTFFLNLPFQPTGERSQRYRTGRQTIGNRRALLVDDDPVSREAVARTLRGWQLQVVEMSDPGAAVRHVLAEGEPYHVLIVDQLMPELTGTEFIAEVRKRPAFANLPIILMSSAADDVVQASGRNTMVLRRPVRPDVMAETLRCLFAATGDATPADPSTAPPEEAGDGVEAAEQMRILVAEDNAINREILARTLASLDIAVDEVSDGAAAVERMREQTYDAVLMDVQMPGMDGLEATAAIRAMPGAAARTPIIALTANAMAGDRERFMDAGMDDYVSKPVDVGQLMRALQRQLAKHEEDALV